MKLPYVQLVNSVFIFADTCRIHSAVLSTGGTSASCFNGFLFSLPTHLRRVWRGNKRAGGGLKKRQRNITTLVDMCVFVVVRDQDFPSPHVGLMTVFRLPLFFKSIFNCAVSAVINFFFVTVFPFRHNQAYCHSAAVCLFLFSKKKAFLTFSNKHIFVQAGLHEVNAD